MSAMREPSNSTRCHTGDTINTIGDRDCSCRGLQKKPRAKNELLYTVVKLFLAVNPLVVALLHVAHIVQMPS